MVFPCDVESSLYCCPDDFVRNTTVTNQTTMKEEKFPVNCGIITIDNKIIGKIYTTYRKLKNSCAPI